MSNPIIPVNDAARLQELYAYDILDSGEEKDFSDITVLAAGICNCERATITFVDKERQWFKAQKNMPVKESPRQQSFCAHAILTQDIFIVTDLSKDKRFSSNPHVTPENGVRFYAGAPIISTGGFTLGTVCVMDSKPKESFTGQQQQALVILAAQVTRLLELRLKNKQIKAQADQMAANEKLISSLSLSAQDDSKLFIANQLHENFAQTLAATRLYLDMAEKTTDMSGYFIKKSKQNITDVIQEIRLLSKKIAPTTFDNEDYVDLIKDLVEVFSNNYNIDVNLELEAEITCLKNKRGLVVYRIVEEIMQVARYSGAKKIDISFNEHTELHISILHDGITDESNMQEQVARKQIADRTHQLDASARFIQNKSGMCGYDIKVPLRTV